MKKLYRFLQIFLLCFSIHALHAQNKITVTQYANTSLSNLSSPAINVGLTPDKDNSHNIGNSINAWKNLYLDTGIYFYGQSFIKVPSKFSWNTIVGINAMHDEPESYGNTAIGYETMYENTDGGENTAVGSLALLHNKTGYSNTVMGYDALNQNKTGSNNTAIGFETLFHDTSGSYNTGFGYNALESNTRGSENVAIGDSAAYAQNTNVYMNTAIGARALRYNITGTANTACGSFALYKNKATNNSAFGNAALSNNSTGSDNTAVGNNAGSNITMGSKNTFLGSGANSGAAGAGTNMTALGSGATVTSNNHVVIGNSSVTSIGGFANWSNLSDGRVKKNTKQNVPGLTFINKLQPITYNLDLDAADKILGVAKKDADDSRIIQPSQFEIESRKAKQQIVYTGFIAQDVEKAAQSLNYDFSGVDKPDNANALYGLRYSDFVVPLVKAVQELSQQNDSLKNQTAIQQKINADLEQRIAKLEAMVNVSNVSTVISSASLMQNIPNPFSNATTINYSLPQHSSSAKIIITDKNGNALKTITLSNNKGFVNVDAATLSSGAYQYSLYIDGRLTDTKQMILSK